MKRKLILLFLSLCVCAAACAQQSTQSNSGFISGTQCVSVPSSGLANGSYGVTGGWTGTLTAYGSVGQGALVSLQSQTANGSYVVSSAGYTLFQVCGNSVASGTAFVQVSASVNSVGGGGLPAGLTYAAPTLTVSTAGSGNGTLALSGNTSGTATFTAPAVAGTVLNPVASSNAVSFPNGTVANPSVVGVSETTTGIYWPGTTSMGVTIGGAFVPMTFSNTDGADMGSGVFLGWCTSNSSCIAGDTGFTRLAAGVVGVGTSNSVTTTGKLKASAYISVGTKFTTNNGCTDGANAGGGSAGYFVVGSTSCTEVITMGDTATAPNGWSCTAIDITTLADVTNPHQTTSTATTATIVTGTVVSADKIQFSCIGY